MPNSTTPSFIIELDSPAALDASVVGSKAASVADLISKGATVPPGFTIPASVFADFIAPIKSDITKILQDVDVEIPSSAFDAADSITELLDATPTPKGLNEAIKQRVNESSGGLAVRSSATAEDLEGASFAGMYDTFLDPTDAESVLRRVRDVWASYYTRRAISYRQRQGIPHDAGSMGVLVMELVNADAGGVVFTRDPRDGTDQILINAALGLGEGVVSGEAQADSFTLDSETFEITRRNVIDKEWMFIQGAAGSTDRVPVPASKRSVPALSDSQLLTVARAASTIKTATGDDRDIEFAFLGETVHILQSRPITTGVKVKTEFPVEWDDPEDERLYWVGSQGALNVNFNAILPLFADVSILSGESAKRGFELTGFTRGRNFLRKMVNGFMYSAEPDFDEEKVALRTKKYQRKGIDSLKRGTTYYYEVVEPLLHANLRELEDARPSEDAALDEYIDHVFYGVLTRGSHLSDLHWRSWFGFKDNDDIFKLYAEITGRPKMEASDLTSGIEHMTSKLIERLIELARIAQSDEWLSNAFQNRDYSAILDSQSDSSPQKTVFLDKFESMLATWGRRSGLGYGAAWLPTDPTWNMKPEIALDSINSFVRQDLTALNQHHTETRIKRERAIQLVRSEIGDDTKLMEKFEFELLRATMHVRMMEDHNYLIEQCTAGEHRESLHRLGAKMVEQGIADDPGDVFYLRIAQLQAARRTYDYSRLRHQIQEAKAQWEKDSLLTPPEYLGTKPPDSDDDANKDQAIRGLSEDGKTLAGEPSSIGVYKGPARVVITRTASPPDVRKGDILVTENTGPDWVPVFPLIGALVLDGGANFQHASLICREYGIPCVIQTKEATAKIADGQLIEVDGTAGTVTLNPIV